MKLFYRKSGTGTPLIILHGLYGSSGNWISVVKELEPFFTLIVPDLRNHGQSPHSVIHNYDSMAADIMEMAEELNLDKFFLAGHSMGGKTAMAFSALYGEMLNGLLIADIAPFTDSERVEAAKNEHLNILNAIKAVDLKSHSKREEIDEILSLSLNHKGTREFLLKNLFRNKEGGFEWKINIESLIGNINEITGTPKVLERLTEPITGFPVIFLRGEYSNYILDSDIPEILSLYPAATIETIRGAGHWLHADNPESVINAIKSLSN